MLPAPMDDNHSCSPIVLTHLKIEDQNVKCETTFKY